MQKKKGISLEEAETQLTRGALYNIDEGWKEAIDSKLDSSDISKYNQAYQYLLGKTKDSSVDQVNSSFYFKTKPDGTIVGRAKNDTYAGHISDSELQKADFYIGEAGKGFTATDEDFKNKDIFLTNTPAGSTDKNSPQYNDKKEFMQNYAAIQSDDLSIWEHVKTSADKDIGLVKGFGKGILTGGANLVESISDSIKGLFGFITDPVGKTEKAVDKANQIKDNLPEITNEIVAQDRIAREKHATTLALYEMQRDAGAKAKYEAQPYGELVGGAGLGSVGKNTVQSVGKAADEVVKNVGDHLTPKPATVAGTPDLNGGATTMTGTPDVNGGIGKTEVAGATMAAGYEQPQNPQGIYDPQGQRADLEAVHGIDNVKSTTVANDPYQRVNSNKEKGIEVIYDSYGNKAVKVEYKDPLTDVTKDANIPYDSRGLPIFDDHAKYTTKIDTSVSYRRQMSQATKDLRDAINAGKISTESFTPTQLKQIKAGSGQIDGYTWHHNAQSSPNNMQLIPEDVHNAALHIGQGSLSEGK